VFVSDGLVALDRLAFDAARRIADSNVHGQFSLFIFQPSAIPLHVRSG
jgi:hypothetical protein